MMFRAHESVEASLFRLFSGPGYTHWRMVERHTDDPWFHVVVKQIYCDGGESAIAEDEGSWDEEIDSDEGDAAYEQQNFSQRVLMPDHTSMLEHILEMASDDIFIEEVQVVLPPLMTGLDRWTMQPLIELSVERSPEGNIINVYTVESGNIYRCLAGWLSMANPLAPIETRVIYRRP